MFLTNRNTMDSHARSVVKGVSWRIVGTIDTIILSYIVTGNIGSALKIGFTEVFTKVFLYYLHERIWNTTSFARTRDKKPSHLRSLLKGISWRAVGTLDTMFIAYFITGVPLDALKIGGFEVFTKVAFFYVHERIWSGIKWGRGTAVVAVAQPEKVEVRETTLQS